MSFFVFHGGASFNMVKSVTRNMVSNTVPGIGEAKTVSNVLKAAKVINIAKKAVKEAKTVKSVAKSAKGAGKVTHNNSLKSTKPTDVYAVKEKKTGQVLRYGETTQGYKKRGQQHARRFSKLGIETETVLLRSGLSKIKAKELETRLIKTHEKVFGSKPPYNKSYH